MNNNICGAKTKGSGKPCQRSPVDGRNRCKLHGGNTPVGSSSPHWRHGMYSRYAGSELKEILEELDGISSDELINADNELKLFQALIIKSQALKDGTDDIDQLEKISRILQRLIKSKQNAVALKIEEERLIPAADVELFLDWMQQLLADRVGHEDANDIIDELSNFKISDHANR